jgi:hypothetical protein
MNRQPKGRNLVRATIYVEPALLAALDDAGHAQSLTRSAMLAQLLRKALPAKKGASA